MKKMILALVALTSLSAWADVGDKYSVIGKLGRMSEQSGLIEIVGLTGSVDHDANPATANVIVKLQLNLMFTSGGGNFEDIDVGEGPTPASFITLGVARESKLTMGIVYDAADIYKTNDCLGKDFIYTDPEDTHGTTKTCYAVFARDIVIK